MSRNLFGPRIDFCVIMEKGCDCHGTDVQNQKTGKYQEFLA